MRVSLLLVVAMAAMAVMAVSARPLPKDAVIDSSNIDQAFDVIRNRPDVVEAPRTANISELAQWRADRGMPNGGVYGQNHEGGTVAATAAVPSHRSPSSASLILSHLSLLRFPFPVFQELM